jgi:alkylated DNA repair dioxygenase AlkB
VPGYARSALGFENLGGDRTGPRHTDCLPDGTTDRRGMTITAPSPTRTWLDETSWVDHQPAWLPNPDDLHRDLAVSLPWIQEITRMHKPAPRQCAWIGMGWSQSSGYTKPLAASPFNPATREVAVVLSSYYGTTFNSVLASRYRDGADSISPHSDGEERLGQNPVIAGVSLGATRTFTVAPIGGVRRSGLPAHRFELASGDLLVLGGTTDHRWLHSIPKAPAVTAERIGLTFRSYAG